MRAILVVAASLVAAWLVSWMSDVGSAGRPVSAVRRSWPGYGSVRRPWTLVVFLAALLVSYPLAGLRGIVVDVTRHVLLIMLMGALTWLVLRVLAIAEEEEEAFRRLPVDIAD